MTGSNLVSNTIVLNACKCCIFLSENPICGQAQVLDGVKSDPAKENVDPLTVPASGRAMPLGQQSSPKELQDMMLKCSELETQNFDLQVKK